MRKVQFLALLLAGTAIAMTSCGKHIMVNFQESSENTGTIVIAPTSPIQKCVLIVDDNLLAETKRRVRKVTISNVPPGIHHVNFSADSWAYKESVDVKWAPEVKPGQQVAKAVPRPPYSTGYYIYLGCSAMASLIPLIWL